MTIDAARTNQEIAANPTAPIVAGFFAQFYTLEHRVSSLAEIDFSADADATATVDRLAYNTDAAFWSGGPQDNFAARFSGNIQINQSGQYTFYLTSDDGSRLSIDGQSVIGNDGLHSATEESVTLYLQAGTHTLDVKYFERAVSQTLTLDWAGPDTGNNRAALDANHVSHTQSGTDTTGGTTTQSATNQEESTQQAAVLAENSSGSEKTTDGFFAQFYTLEHRVSSLAEIDFSADADATATVDRLAYNTDAAFWSGGPQDNFAARFSGNIQITQSGQYTFFLTSDDGSRLSIDGQSVIGNDGLHSATEESVTLYLQAGTHTLDVKYFERAVSQTLTLDWAGPDTGNNRAALDANHVSHTQSGTDTTGGTTTQSATNQEESTQQAAVLAENSSGSEKTTDGFFAQFFTLEHRVSSLAEIDFSADADATATVDRLAYNTDAAFWSGGPQDNFAARFSGNIEITQSGQYTFFLTSDDGSRLSIDGQSVIGNDGLHSATEESVTLYLQAGTHTLDVKYFERAVSQTLTLDWAGPDTGNNRAALDANHVSHTQSGTDTTGGTTTEPITTVAAQSLIGNGEASSEGDAPVVVNPKLAEWYQNNGQGDETDPEVPADVSPVTSLDGNINAVSGRVTTLELDDATTVTGVTILDMPQHGNLTVNPDNTLALVMTTSDYTGAMSFRYQATYSDGSTKTLTQNVNVVAGSQEAGWGQGNFYMLETDANGDVIVEHGDNHRKVYISGSNDALSKADIAALEGLSVSQITGAWLEAHPQYGGSEGMALDADAGMELWNTVTGWLSDGPSSNWLMFENGYQYDVGPLIKRGSYGESEWNPLHITSYGSGDRAVITSELRIYQVESKNIVFSDLELSGGVYNSHGNNLLFDNIHFTKGDQNFLSGQGLTIRNSEIVDVIKETPTSSDLWRAFDDRKAGLFVRDTDHILLEGNLVDHNGWADGYHADLSTDGGQPPGIFSHNVYLQWDTTDVTFRDNIISRGASFGAQIRGGGFIEDNAFIDNNFAVNFLGGIYSTYGAVGNYSLFTDNVITSGANKYADGPQGALTAGIQARGMDSTLLNNIVAHLADPNSAQEQAEKIITHNALSLENDPFYNDTTIYNWIGANKDYLLNYMSEAERNAMFDANVEDLNTSILNQTTIQNYAAQVLGNPNATIADLMEYLKAKSNGVLDNIDDADLIIAYFQAGFGLAVDGRLGSDTLRFVPSALGDGIRWDNRLNWDTDDLPGTIDGDSVDLAGNWVNYGGTTTIENMDFGSDGRLSVNHGRLTIEGDLKIDGTGSAQLKIDGTGRFWTDGYSDTNTLEISISGGRFANTGTVDGTVAMVVTDGQALLAVDTAKFDLSSGSNLTITGSEAKVGFDGESNGISVLRLDQDANLSFVADANGFSTIEEFRSGHFDQSGANVQSGVNLGLSDLNIDISDLNSSGSQHTLITADELIGEFANINLAGLASNQNARIDVDYTADTVTLHLLTAGQGNGTITLQTIGDQNDAQGNTGLWTALTQEQGAYSDNIDTAISNSIDSGDILFA